MGAKTKALSRRLLHSQGTASSVLLIDVSNTFTKVARAKQGVIGRVRRIHTERLSSATLPLTGISRAVISSVVPAADAVLEKKLPCPILSVDHRTATGVTIRYPEPASIGADRLANAAAAVDLGKLPAIVVDFGTAVTFDVIDGRSCYLGGIIAPGLRTAARSLHERTALLPLTGIGSIGSSVGKSTRGAIRIGLLLGAVGLVREAVARITAESFQGRKPFVIATGGDADLVTRLSGGGGRGRLIDRVDPLLTLRGLLVIAGKTG